MEALFSDPRCLGHEVPYGFPERPRRLERVLERLEGRGAGPIVAGDSPRAREAVAAVHAAEYVERFRRASERGDGLLGSSDNPLSAGTWDAAWAAVGCALAAAERAAAGGHAFAAVRPPGHHAERDLAMGFCFFNNVAVAARDLIARGAARRVAIFDFDVHHGNGTQHVFERSADVFYASIHQYPFYPGTGAADERGLGEGEGATLNVPLPAGCGDAEYREAIDGRVLPALAAYRPDVLLVSAGFDAWKRDLLGGMRVGEEGFADWGRRLGALAREVCGSRILSVLEGGYDLHALPDLVEGYLDGVAEGLG